MRLKEDSSSWKSRSIIRRDFRHTHGEPEVPKGHPKRKQSKPRPPKQKPCKHVWVKVTYTEWLRYRDGGRYNPWWLYLDLTEPPFWSTYTTYYVCPGCDGTKAVTDRGKQRVFMRKRYGRAW